MSPLTWLPPLNSHEGSDVSIFASQLGGPRKFESLAEPLFAIMSKVTVQFRSEEPTNQKAFYGLYLQEKRYILCRKITGSSIEGRRRILDMLSHMYLPSKLENIVFGVINQGKDSGPKVLEDMNNLAEKIRDFFCNITSSRSCNGDQKVFWLTKLEIDKVIKIPESEHRAWTSWFEEKKRVDPDFERNYMNAISRRRTTEELLQEAKDASAFRPASRSSIEALKDVMPEDGSSTTSCLICLEDLLPVGSKISCMPCSHIFHRDCIVEWLRKCHMCPLCRFRLPC